MAGDERKESEEVKTSIDALLDLIKSKGLMDVSSAASQLGIASSIAEQWAKILEENNLVKISYRVGKMFVEPSVVTKSDIKLAETKMETKKDMLEEEVSVQLEQISKIGEIIGAAKISAGNAETIFKQKAPEEQQMLNELNRVYANVEKQYGQIEESKKRAEEANDRINKALSDTFAKIGAYSSSDLVRSMEEAKTRMEEASKNASGINSAINATIKEKDKAVEDIKKSMNEQIASLRAQLDQAVKDTNSRLKVSLDQVRLEEAKLREQSSLLHEATQSMERFSKEKAVMEKELNAARVSFNDQYSVRKQELEKNLPLFEERMKSFYSKVKEMKDAFGDVANIFDSIAGAKKDLDEVSAKLNDVKAEAARLSEALKALSASRLPIGGSADALGRLSKSSNEINSEISGIRDDIKRATGRIKPKDGSDQDKGVG